MKIDAQKDLIGRYSTKESPSLLKRLNKMEITYIGEDKFDIKVFTGEVRNQSSKLYSNTVVSKDVVRFSQRLADKYKVVRQNVIIKDDTEETKSTEDT